MKPQTLKRPAPAVVRNGLRQLKPEGLVRIEPNRGAIVTSLSLNDVLGNLCLA